MALDVQAGVLSCFFSLLQIFSAAVTSGSMASTVVVAILLNQLELCNLRCFLHCHIASKGYVQNDGIPRLVFDFRVYRYHVGERFVQMLFRSPDVQSVWPFMRMGREPETFPSAQLAASIFAGSMLCLFFYS